MQRAFLALLVPALVTPLGMAQQSLCTPQDLTVQPNVAVQSVKVEGGQELNEAAAAATKPAFTKQRYRDCELKDALAEAAERVRRLFQEHGYFKAEVEDAQTRPAGQGKTDVLFAVTPGLVYRLTDIGFREAKAFPAAQLRPLFALQSGDVFNVKTFSEGLERLRDLYRSRGYINFAPVPEPTFNDEARTIAWTIDMDEGHVYRLGALLLDGVEPARGVGKTLLLDWQRLMGQVYNPELLRQFLQEHAALLRVRNPDPQRLFDTLLDTQDHIVTMRLNFPE